MISHHLLVEQRFHLEAFREIDSCQDLEKLREVTKQIITAQENEKSFAREAISQLRNEMEFVASKNTVLTVGKAELFLDWLFRNAQVRSKSGCLDCWRMIRLF